jgi:hypothetical protein
VLAVACGLAWAPGARAGSVAQRCAQLAENGEDLRASHRLVGARASFLQCAREECPEVVRRDCERWRVEVEASLPSVVLSARGTHGEDLGDVRVVLDGAPLVDHLDGVAIAIDPGSHVLRFERAGEPPLEQRVLVREGEKNRIVEVEWASGSVESPTSPPPAAQLPQLTATLPAPRSAPPPLSPRARNLTPAYVIGGLGLGSLVASLFLEIRGVNDWNYDRSTCGVDRTCTSAQVNDVKSELWGGNISFFVGLAAIGAAAWIILSRPRSADVVLRLEPRAGGGATTLVARFW